MKQDILKVGYTSLNQDEALIGLAISATTNPAAQIDHRRAAPATGRRGPSPRRRRRRVEDARRDEVDYLPENGVYCLRCFWWGCFHNPVGYRQSPPDATLNFHPFANTVSEWDANERDGVDRTKDELIEDAKSIYEEYGKLFNGGSMK